MVVEQKYPNMTGYNPHPQKSPIKILRIASELWTAAVLGLQDKNSTNIEGAVDAVVDAAKRVADAATTETDKESIQSVIATFDIVIKRLNLAAKNVTNSKINDYINAAIQEVQEASNRTSLAQPEAKRRRINEAPNLSVVTTRKLFEGGGGRRSKRRQTKKQSKRRRVCRRQTRRR